MAARSAVCRNRDIVLKKDLRRWRKIFSYHLCRGRVRAEIELDSRIEKIAESLQSKVDFANWKLGDKSFESQTDHMLSAILREFGGEEGLHVAQITTYLSRLLVIGALQYFDENRELEVKKDRLGRKMYRIKPTNY